MAKAGQASAGNQAGLEELVWRRRAAVIDRADLGERRAILGKQGKKCGVHEGTNMDGKRSSERCSEEDLADV